jgi:hypothetical protein
MSNAKGPMTKEVPNPKSQNRRQFSAQRSWLGFFVWSFLGHLSFDGPAGRSLSLAPGCCGDESRQNERRGVKGPMSKAQ